MTAPLRKIADYVSQAYARVGGAGLQDYQFMTMLTYFAVKRKANSHIEMASKPDPERETLISHSVGGKEPRRIPVLKLDSEDEKDVKEWFEIASKITIMVTGETGVGKSTLLNALVGHPVLETGRSKKQAVTTHVTECKCMKDGIEIVAIDCPGLHDGTDNEDMYLQEMYDRIDAHGGINLLLYCKKMTDRRADPKGDADIITKLTDKLGRGIWQHTLFVLTFANVYEERMKERHQNQDDITAQFEQKKKEWEIRIGETLKKCGIDEGECINIKVCAAGFKQPQLCGKPYWLSDFWASAYKVQDENGALALLHLNVNRIVKDAPNESFKQDLHQHPIILTKKLKKALRVLDGQTVGATAGAAIGAAIGIALGGGISAVPAATFGVMIGGAAGAAIGSYIGAAIHALYRRRKDIDKQQKVVAAAKKHN